jgi:uncharacterized protein YrzB (UPF0473 family)
MLTRDKDENSKDVEEVASSHGCDEVVDQDQRASMIVMTDMETGEEYTFELADDFIFEDEHYCILVTPDDAPEPEMVITRVVKMDDGTDGLMSLDDERYDRVYEAYERFCEDEADEEADGEETT